MHPSRLEATILWASYLAISIETECQRFSTLQRMPTEILTYWLTSFRAIHGSLKGYTLVLLTDLDIFFCLLAQIFRGLYLLMIVYTYLPTLQTGDPCLNFENLFHLETDSYPSIVSVFWVVYTCKRVWV
ncbi:hypothetical protein DSO57_1013660 [Entomophthora muscae]|uniref:Uncharacterized protein n=1 Tax=Entomophthora muscae TaxID=34485 RepID=A0ACC2T5R9_9FUNG|nr:hypothetical protein DSO57_1013660 [Entomophthora muscae]